MKKYLNFLVLVDGSKKAFEGVSQALRMRKPEDRIIMMNYPETLESQSKTEKVRQ